MKENISGAKVQKIVRVDLCERVRADAAFNVVLANMMRPTLVFSDVKCTPACPASSEPLRTPLLEAIFMQLISFCVGVILSAGIVGQSQAASSRDVVAEIMKLGGTVEIDSTQVGSPIVKVDLHGTKVTDADLTLLADLADLKVLDLRLTDVGDEGMRHLEKLRNLRSLNMFRTQLTDEGLRHLQALGRLDTLMLGGTKVSSAGMALLKPLTELRKVSLFNTQVDDQGLDAFVGMSKLEVLLLGKSKTSEEGQRKLKAAHPGLRFDEAAT